jgi:hypothetical protein
VECRGSEETNLVKLHLNTQSNMNLGFILEIARRHSENLPVTVEGRPFALTLPILRESTMKLPSFRMIEQ